MTRSRHPCGRRWPQAIACALSTAVAVLLTALVADPGALAATTTAIQDSSAPPPAGPGTGPGPARPGTGPHRSWVRYYIVPPVQGGTRAYLVGIAAETLGSGSRHMEIFNLNKGRLQPGGARMESPDAVGPGWILILPADARGPGVQFGPLPAAYGASQPGAVRTRVLSVLAGCLALLTILVSVFAARAWLKAPKRRGRHTYQGARPHTAERPRRGALGDLSSRADADAAPSGDGGTAEPAGLPQAVATGVISAPGAAAVPSPAAADEPDHRIQADGVAVPAQATLSPQVPGMAARALNGRDHDKPALRGPDSAAPDPGRGQGQAAQVADQPAFSPAALRLLGVRTSAAGSAAGGEAAIRRHEVVLGDCRVQAVLAEAPASTRQGRAPDAQTWVASTPYLVWTPLPHDVPGGGLAFACVGAGDEGCLFVDLAAAPGAVAFGGERESAARLAESIAYQLCSGPAQDRIRLVVVGDAVPSPHPPGMEWVPSTGELGSGSRQSRDTPAELVFCRLNTSEDVFPLARYVASARHRVIPLVLADLPGASWSFTADPCRRPVGVLQPVVS